MDNRKWRRCLQRYRKTGGPNRLAVARCLRKAYPLGDVLHVGAHTGEERELYNALVVPIVTWVEASASAFAELRRQVKRPRDRFVHATAWSETGTKMRLSHLRPTHTWFSGRTTLYELRRQMSGEFQKPRAFEDVTTTALDDILKPGFETVVIDIQGAEFEAMQGMPQIIDGASNVIVEACFDNIAGGPVTLPAIIEWLHARGFVLTYYQGYQPRRPIGDALFQRTRANG